MFDWFDISAMDIFIATLPLLIPSILLIVVIGLFIKQLRHQKRLIEQHDEIIRLLVKQDRKTHV